MITEAGTQTVTTTYEMSNGKVFTTTAQMTDDDLYRARREVRSLASNHMPIIINNAGASTDYLNPNHVSSINLTVVTER